MNIYSVHFPLSLMVVVSSFIIGIVISTIFFGSTLFIIFIILGFFGIIKIIPIFLFINKIICAIWDKSISKTMDNIRKSFPIEGGEGKENQKGIYVFHPHGVFSISQFFHAATNLTDWNIRPIRVTSLSILWWIPFLGEIFDYYNICKSNYEDMTEALEKGDSLSVCLGGSREILYTKAGVMKLNIKNKVGIFRMALETGTPLIPVIAYGENEIYEIARSDIIDYIQKILIQFGAILPLSTLRSYLNWITLVNRPLKVPIRTVIGDVIPVKKCVATDKDIKELRELYFDSLRALYKKTKPDSYANELIIV